MATAVLDVDQEIKRRARDRCGHTPATFPDGLGEHGAPWGAIVDGYQKIRDTWHRIDRPGDIDLDALNGALAFSGNRPLSLEQAVEMWRESIGELEGSGHR